MMRKLDKRGTAALEFCVVAVLLFTLMFAIFDFGRYAITMHSLRALADAGARAWMICYQDKVVVQSQSPAGCSGDPIPDDSKKQDIAPLLYAGGLTPTLTATQVASNTTVTASLPGFTMLFPTFQGTALNNTPSASTSVPF
jgi:hypothetical protein